MIEGKMKEKDNLIQNMLEKVKLAEEKESHLEQRIDDYEHKLDTLHCDLVETLEIELGDLKKDNETEKGTDILIENTFNNPSMWYKCDICDFAAKSEADLIHTRQGNIRIY